MTERLAKYFPFLLLVPALLPLVIYESIMYPYLVPKTLLLRALGIITLAVFIYLVGTGRPFYYARLRSHATWIPGALLAVAYVASIFGTGFYRSFWSIFDRGDGLLTLTVLIGFFYLILITADRAFLTRLLKTVAVVGTLAALFGLFQWIGSFAGFQIFSSNADRIGGPLGNAAFFAAYLGMSAFVTLASVSRWAMPTWQTAAYAATGLQIFVAFLTSTRGTILALALAGFLWLAYAAWAERGRVRQYAIGTLLLLLVAGGIFFAFRSEIATVPFEPIRRIASISTSDTTVASRLFIWTNVFQESLTHPFLGVGADHIQSLFDKVYDPPKIVEQWFDRTHNSFLDYFVQYGIAGLILYLLLIGALLVEAIRRFRNGEPGAVALVLVSVVYATQNFFVFDTAVTLWLLFALLAALYADRDAALGTAPSVLATPFPKVLTIGTPMLLLVLLIPVTITPLRANLYLFEGYKYQLTDVERFSSLLEKGYALGTYADVEYGYQVYSIYGRQDQQLTDPEDRRIAYQTAENILSKNFDRYPYDPRTATYLAHVMDTAPAGEVVDEIRLHSVIDRAIALSPKRAQPWYLLANISLRKADAATTENERSLHYKEAIRVLETYAVSQPTLAVPRYVLTTLYYRLGDLSSAKKWADEAYPLYTTPDAAAAGPAVKYYIAVEDWERAVRFLADLVAESPQDYDILYDLAKVTYLAGDPATALRIVEHLRANNPEILATDPNFLAAITDYESR